MNDSISFSIYSHGGVLYAWKSNKMLKKDERITKTNVHDKTSVLDWQRHEIEENTWWDIDASLNKAICITSG